MIHGGSRTAARAAGAALAVLLAATAAAAQTPVPTEAAGLPDWGGPGFDGPYPARTITVETARLLEGGRGHVGFGDTRYSILDRRLEVVTNTISDIIGVGVIGAKLGILDPAERPIGLAVGGKYYHSYGGLIDLGVEAIAESFAEVTDSEIDVRGVIGFATATWSADERTNLHAAVQVHHPIQTVFGVEDSVAGGGGEVVFTEGDDVSAMWAVDRQLAGRKLVALLEAGWSFGLEEPRFGAGIDAGSQKWRVLFGVSFPGVETDLATDPRDLFVTPALSVHYRF